MPVFVNWNGKIVPEERVIISPNNRSFRYGDGCFETLKIIQGNLLLKGLHFDRLFSSLETLQFSSPQHFTANRLSNEILELANANKHQQLARIRLTVYRGNGGLYDLDDLSLNYLIQTWAGNPHSNTLNDTGLHADFFPDAKKTADRFSCIKSNNYLGYAMGALWAKQQKLDDCFLSNAFNRVADATIANVFIVNKGIIQTPLLSEGCVSGVMRKYLLNCLSNEDIPFLEAEITPEDLLNASEVFLTNATYGIRWIKKVQNSNYNNTTASALHKQFIIPLFAGTTI